MQKLKVFSLEGIDKTKGDAKILEDILRVFSKDNEQKLNSIVSQDISTESYYLILKEFVEWCAKLPQPVDVSIKKLSHTPIIDASRISQTTRP